VYRGNAYQSFVGICFLNIHIRRFNSQDGGGMCLRGFDNQLPQYHLSQAVIEDDISIFEVWPRRVRSRAKMQANIVLFFDVWLTVHRSSMWVKRPTRCHF